MKRVSLDISVGYNVRLTALCEVFLDNLIER
jgi:hypothetical protein